MLYQVFEKLNEMGLRFLDAGQISDARCLVDAYRNLSEAAIQIEFIGEPHENPIAYQVAFSLKDFVEAAKTRGDQEVPFRAIQTFTRLGEYAARRSNVTLIATASSELDSIAIFGVRSHGLLITEHCLRAECRMIRSLFYSSVDIRFFAGQILEHIFQVHLAAVRAQNHSSKATFESVGVLLSPFKELQGIVDWFLREYRELDRDHRSDFTRNFQSFLDSLDTNLRSAFEDRGLDSVYANATTDLVGQILRVCGVKEKNPKAST